MLSATIYGRRHLIVFMCFCINAVNYAQKVNLSVGIVVMIDNSHNTAFKVDKKKHNFRISKHHIN